MPLIKDLISKESKTELYRFKKYLKKQERRERKSSAPEVEIMNSKSLDYIVLGTTRGTNVEAEIGDILRIRAQMFEVTVDSFLLMKAEVVQLLNIEEELSSMDQAIELALNYNTMMQERSDRLEKQGSKVYMKPGYTAPKGVKVYTGPGGGKYYISTPKMGKTTTEESLEPGRKPFHISVTTARERAEEAGFKETPEGRRIPRKVTLREDGEGRALQVEAGPLKTPWYRTAGVKVTETTKGTQYAKKDIVMEIRDTGAGWIILENNKFIDRQDKERDAVEAVKDRFEQLGS